MSCMPMPLTGHALMLSRVAQNLLHSCWITFQRFEMDTHPRVLCIWYGGNFLRSWNSRWTRVQKVDAFCSAPVLGFFPMSLQPSQRSLSSAAVYAFVRLLLCFDFLPAAWLASSSLNKGSPWMSNS